MILSGLSQGFSQPLDRRTYPRLFFNAARFLVTLSKDRSRLRIFLNVNSIPPVESRFWERFESIQIVLISRMIFAMTASSSSFELSGKNFSMTILKTTLWIRETSGMFVFNSCFTRWLCVTSFNKVYNLRHSGSLVLSILAIFTLKSL
jgi:hypothetical protein